MSTLRPQFAKTALKLAENDPATIVLVGDISHGLFGEYRKKFPDRYINVGIMEPAMVSIAAGLAKSGFNPIVHTIAPFLIERSFEQIKLDFSYQGLGCTLVSVGGAFDYSKLGCTHHSYVDSALIDSLDESQVFSPGSESELDSLMMTSHNLPGVKYLKLTEFGHDYKFGNDQIEIGKAIEVSREDSKHSLVALGPSLKQVLEAKSVLNSLGHNVDIWYFHTLKPLNREQIAELISSYDSTLVVEHNATHFGLAKHFYEINSNLRLGKQIKDLSIRKFVREYGSYPDLLEEAELGVTDIVESMEALIFSHDY